MCSKYKILNAMKTKLFMGKLLLNSQKGYIFCKCSRRLYGQRHGYLLERSGMPPIT